MRIAIAGSSGLIGRAVRTHLARRGHEIVRLVRRTPAAADERAWDPVSGSFESPSLGDVDAVLNLCGAGLGDQRWSPERKAELVRSRLDPTAALIRALSPNGRCRRLLNASAVGFYGDTGPAVVDEDNPGGAGFLAGLVASWEATAAVSPVPVALLRSGVVLTPEGGFLGPQWLPFRLGLGGRIGSGRQFLSWIHIADHLRAVEYLLTSRLSGPVNLVSPNPVTNEAFTRVFAAHLGRPAVIPIPLPALRLLYGSELVAEAMLSGTRVQPRRLLDAGFSFDHPDLGEALGALDEVGAAHSQG